MQLKSQGLVNFLVIVQKENLIQLEPPNLTECLAFDDVPASDIPLSSSRLVNSSSLSSAS